MNQLQKIDLKEVLEKELTEKQARNPLYSIRALARDIDVPYTSISRLLKSNVELNLKHKYKVGMFLKIPKADLLDFIFAEVH